MFNQLSQTNIGLAQVVRMEDMRKVSGEFEKVELKKSVLESIREATGMINLSLDVHDLTSHHSEKLLGQT